MEQERDYQAVYFKDLFITIARQWRKVVIALLIGAILLTAAQYITALTNPKSKKPAVSGDTLTQREQINQALEDTNMRIETQRIYLSTSPLMSIDPNNFYQASLTLYIHTDYKIDPSSSVQSPDSMPSILFAYQQILTDADVVTSMAEITGLPGQYLHELITPTITEAHPGILKVTINSADQETTKVLLDMLTQTIQDSEATVESMTKEEHTLLLQVHEPVLCADTSIADLQKAAYQRLTTLQNQKIEWQKQQQQTSLSISSVDANPLLIACVGGAIGFILAVSYICIRHLSTGKIYSVRTLKNRTGIKVLGTVRSPGKIGAFHRWLNKLEGRCVHPEQMAVMVALLQNYCAKKQKVMITTSCGTIQAEALKKAITDAAVPCILFDCLLTDPQALQELPSCDAVILLEQCNYSHVSQIDHAVQIISDENVPLLGCVLIDG